MSDENDGEQLGVLPRYSRDYLLAVAFSIGGVAVKEVRLSSSASLKLHHLLNGLASLGHVAAFEVAPSAGIAGYMEVKDWLSRCCGSFVVDAVERSPATQPTQKPAFLLPVWPFDHEIDGRVAATGRFLDLDLELTATPSPDEEIGVSLPGESGFWLLSARPLSVPAEWRR